MSLRHAILGVLSAKPMTGYDLVRYFDESVAYVWSAPQSQIYPELRRMESLKLVQASVEKRGRLAEKRIYRITRTGETELRRWVAEQHRYSPERDTVRLKSNFFDMVPFESARAILRAHITYNERRAEQWQERVDIIRARGGAGSLLSERLAERDPKEHDAIVGFKAYTYEGSVARARTEIEWARAGLRLVDKLEAAWKRKGAKGRATLSRAKAYPPGPSRPRKRASSTSPKRQRSTRTG